MSALRRIRLVLLALPVVLFAACEEASITDPEIPGGGQELVLDFARFETEIAPIFTEDQKKLICRFLQDNDAAVDKFLTKAAESP